MSNKKRKGAQLLVECLVKHNVKHIFGIPGAKIDAVFDALVDSPIKLILCRHEQNAAFMASAYGRITGQPGVVLVTSGPGVSNLTTGLITATTEGDPVVAIGGNVSRNMRLKESHQKIDNIKLMEAVTKDRKEIILAENIPEIVENAFRTATLPRSGSVFISVPQDVLTDVTEVDSGKPILPITRGPAPQQSLEHAAELLNQAKQPVLFLGLEASRPENAAAVCALLRQKSIATIGTYQAAGVVSRELLSCFIGRVGLFKNQPGDILLDTADVVLTVGFNPVEYDPEIWNNKQKKTIISLDYNPADIHIDYSPDLELIGDIATNLTQLTPLLKKRDTVHHIALVESLHQALRESIASGAKITGKKIHPLRFIHDLRENVDDDTTIISDIGTHHMWLARYFFCFNPRHLLFSNGQQTLGVALPWAIAASLVRPGGKIVSISGDGGFLFSAGELETAVREQANFVHFVWCDGAYDMVKQQQLIKYRRACGVEFGYVDIVKYAESFGAIGMRINHADEFVDILKKAMSIPGPVLVEVPIDYSDNHKLFKDATDT